ncbi:MAG: 50S ribosomal protein L24 [Proteobacteria bacterium]|nr:50S ribosomal protein L24 [Pseudomonadota bacterium]MCP4918233.1 50S ribosomal protein L24 [Pseudomonadota bacterium]
MATTNFKIRRGDNVVVTAGKDKGKTGKVLKVLPARERIVVEGVGLVKKHQKPAGEQPGQIVTREAAIHISNVALWNEAEGRRIKVAFSRDEDGKKIRVDRKSGARIDG